MRRVLLLWLMVFVTGCGAKGPPVAQVSGTVTYKGEPLAHAKVLFISAVGRPAQGETDAAGKFTLTTNSPGDGAVVGEHTIVITKLGPPAGMSEAEFQEKRKTAAAGSTVPGKSAIPDKYTMVQSSPLKATVPAGGNSSLEVKLD